MADRNLDEYHPLAFYKKHSTSKKSGFSSWKVDGAYYFCRHIDGEIAVLSQAYKSAAGRDNGIESVKKNSKIKERFVFDTREGGKHGFSLRAGNRQEVGISPDYTSKSKAESVAGRLNGSVKSTGAATTKVEAPKKATPKKAAPKKAAPKKKAASGGQTFTQTTSSANKSATKKAKPKAKTAKVAAAGAALAASAATGAKRANNEDNYKPLAFYERQTKGKENGIETFKGDDGLYYFAHFENGKIRLISEGYPTTGARDTGVASVEKNIGMDKRYQFRGPLKNGKYDYKLKAGNGKEIARSVWYGSAAAAATGAAYLMGTRKRVATIAPTPVQTAEPAGAPVDVTPVEAEVETGSGAKLGGAAALTAAGAGMVAMSASASEPEVKAEAETSYAATSKPEPVAADNWSYESEKKGIWGWLRWLLLLALLLLLLLFLLKSCVGAKPEVTAPVVQPVLVSCWDESEAESLAACPTKITCWDGSFVKSEAACPIETVTCWDGSSATELANCPVEPVVVEEPEPAPEVVVETPEPAASQVRIPTTFRNGAASAAAMTAVIGKTIFSPGNENATVLTRLGTYPEFGDSHGLTANGFYDKLLSRHQSVPFDRNYLDYIAREIGYGSFTDIPRSAFSEVTVPNGSRGMLGAGEFHDYHYTEFAMDDPRDLEAFYIQSLNGKDIHFMKTCGNYFYITG